MRRILSLAPKLGTLSHAKAVLLVDNGQPEVMELHGVFDEGMGSHNDMDASVVQSA